MKIMIDIPDKATNGDVMMEVLPIDQESAFQGTDDKGVHVSKLIVFVNLIGHLGSVYFLKEWWDAPTPQPFINKPCVSEGACREDKIQVLDKMRAELIQSIQNRTLKIESGNEELFSIIDKYKKTGSEV